MLIILCQGLGHIMQLAVADTSRNIRAGGNFQHVCQRSFDVCFYDLLNHCIHVKCHIW